MIFEIILVGIAVAREAAHLASAVDIVAERSERRGSSSLFVLLVRGLQARWAARVAPIAECFAETEARDRERCVTVSTRLHGCVGRSDSVVHQPSRAKVLPASNGIVLQFKMAVPDI